MTGSMERESINLKQYWIVLPTYCESKNLPVILSRLALLDLDFQILIVDDNSPDGTGDLADDHDAKYNHIHSLRRGTGRGLGSAYLAGFKFALDAGAEAVITMDCDLSHQPEELPSIIAAMRYAGVVIGSRYTDGGRIENWPRHRRLLSAAANRFVRLLFGMPVRDYTSGFRAYRREIVEEIVLRKPDSPGYSFLVEVLCVAIGSDQPVREVPIRFVEREIGDSKMRWREIALGISILLSLRGKMFLNGRSIGEPLRLPRPTVVSAEGADR